MKKTLLFALALGFCSAVNAQFFTQDFSSSTTVANYVSSTPTSGQFEGLTQGSAGSALETSINNGALRFNRTAAFTMFAYRNFDFTTKPTFVQFKMDFEASTNAVGTQTPIFSVFIGSGFSSASTGTTSNYASRFGILAQSTPGNFKVGTVDNIGGAPQSGEFSGKQTITFIVNNSGSDRTYTAPDATTESVANGKMDVWIGITKGINDFSLRNTVSPTADISGFKIQATSASGTGLYDFDNIEMTDLLGNAVLSTSSFDDMEANFTAFPNPTTGAFEINVPKDLNDIKLDVYNIQAQLVFSKSFAVNNGKVSLDLANNPTGIYFVKVNLDSPNFVKVIKK